MNRRPLPAFERLTGRLWFRGRLVHERKQKPAPLVEDLLLQFDEAGWPEALEARLPDGALDPRQQLIESVRRLNKALRGRYMRFHIRGAVITWEDRSTGAGKHRTRRVRGVEDPERRRQTGSDPSPSRNRNEEAAGPEHPKGPQASPFRTDGRSKFPDKRHDVSP
jgi:hypothetical protein